MKSGSAARSWWATALVISGLGLSGCGLLPAVAVRTTSAAGTAAATSTNEVPTPPGPKEQVGRGAPTPVSALRAFAQAYINWTAQDVAERLRSLARTSVGQARSELELAAAEVAVDSQLKSGEIGNSGTVEAVAPLSGNADRYVVITRELTTAANSAAYAGLGPTWHLTIATVERVPIDGGVAGEERWAVSGWQPQS